MEPQARPELAHSQSKTFSAGAVRKLEEQELAKAYKAHDHENDGQMTLDEFTEWYTEQSGAGTVERTLDVAVAEFMAVDVDGDGLVVRGLLPLLPLLPLTSALSRWRRR